MRPEALLEEPEDATTSRRRNSADDAFVQTLIKIDDKPAPAPVATTPTGIPLAKKKEDAEPAFQPHRKVRSTSYLNDSSASSSSASSSTTGCPTTDINSWVQNHISLSASTSPTTNNNPAFELGPLSIRPALIKRTSDLECAIAIPAAVQAGSPTYTPSMMFHTAEFIGTDDDFLMKTSMRAIFRDNAVESSDAVLFSIPVVAGSTAVDADEDGEDGEEAGQHPALRHFRFRISEEGEDGWKLLRYKVVRVAIVAYLGVGVLRERVDFEASKSGDSTLSINHSRADSTSTPDADESHLRKMASADRPRTLFNLKLVHAATGDVRLLVLTDPIETLTWEAFEKLVSSESTLFRPIRCPSSLSSKVWDSLQINNTSGDELVLHHVDSCGDRLRIDNEVTLRSLFMSDLIAVKNGAVRLELSTKPRVVTTPGSGMLPFGLGGGGMGSTPAPNPSARWEAVARAMNANTNPADGSSSSAAVSTTSESTTAAATVPPATAEVGALDMGSLKNIMDELAAQVEQQPSMDARAQLESIANAAEEQLERVMVMFQQALARRAELFNTMAIAESASAGQ
ncbi:hypothetical protein HK101_005748, partial [Irineochytrium annulatum]